MQILLMQLKHVEHIRKVSHITGSLKNGKAAFLQLVIYISYMFKTTLVQLYSNSFSSIGVSSASILMAGPGRGLAQ